MTKNTGLTTHKQFVLRTREKIIKYYLQGFTNIRELAIKVSAEETRSISYGTVFRTIKTITDDWERDNKDLMGQYKFTQLRRLDKLETEAWAAWERSKMPVRTIQNKQTPLEDTSGRRKKKPTITINEQIETLRESAGEKKFLDTVQWCIEQRLEIMTTMATPAAEADKPGSITNNTTIRQIIFKGRNSTGAAQTIVVTE